MNTLFKLIRILLLPSIYSLSSQAFGFTLNTNTSAAFSGREVKFYLTSNSVCENIGITTAELLSLAKEAATDFWNRVPTSSIRLKHGGIISSTNALYLTGKLCANDDNQSCDSTTSVPLSNDIIIACNNNSENFPATNILALTGPTNTSGSKISGSVLLINNIPNSGFSLLSSQEQKAVLAHELGHALGLGHSKKDEALMYYLNPEKIHRLSQDDIDGISYLYPNKLDGCGSFFGGMTLRDNNDKGVPPNSSQEKSTLPFIFSITYGIVFIILLINISKFHLYLLRRVRHFLIS